MASSTSSSTNVAANIVKQQQSYATAMNLAKLFEDLTTALIFSRPPDPADFLASECDRMAEQGANYRAKPLNAIIDTEESAAAYWEEKRVRPLLEVSSLFSFSKGRELCSMPAPLSDCLFTSPKPPFYVLLYTGVCRSYLRSR